MKREEDGRSPEEVNLGDSFAKRVCVGGQWKQSRKENVVELK